jgi:hypothetical protein
MADAGTLAARAVRGAAESFRLLNLEQRVAAVAALLLIASTFGPFSFVEAAEIVTALGVLALLYARARGRRFHLPWGDGTAIAAAGIWVGLLIVVRLFDRPLGQNLLALACAAILALAGAAERAQRPPDDLPEDPYPGPSPAPVDRTSAADPAAGARPVGDAAPAPPRPANGHQPSLDDPFPDRPDD